MGCLGAHNAVDAVGGLLPLSVPGLKAALCAPACPDDEWLI